MSFRTTLLLLAAYAAFFSQHVLAASVQETQLSIGLAPPVISDIIINNGSRILLGFATTSVPVEFRITDSHGCADVAGKKRITVRMFREGEEDACATGLAECYETSQVRYLCDATNTTGNARAVLDFSSFSAKQRGGNVWVALVTATDSRGAIGSARSETVHVMPFTEGTNVVQGGLVASDSEDIPPLSPQGTQKTNGVVSFVGSFFGNIFSFIKNLFSF